MAIGGSPPTAPREKDGGKGTAGRYGFVAEVLRSYLGGLWMARDPSDPTETGTVFVRHIAPIPTASAKAAILDAARFAQTAANRTLEIVEGKNSVDLVTPFGDAEAFRSLLRTAALKHTAISPAVLLGIACDTLEQVEALHDAAHRNRSPHGFGGLHPDSILVGTDGRVQLLDAGVSAAASAREPWKSDVQRIGYLAPEQLDVRGVADPRSDVFALGVVLWEAFANRRLFPGADAKSARDRVQKAPIARLDASKTTSAPGVSTPIADLVARTLDRDPSGRFQSAAELGTALRALGRADSAEIGAWVTSLADTAIAKRRQFLARISVAPLARTSVPPAVRGAPLAARTSVPPAARVPVEVAIAAPVPVEAAIAARVPVEAAIAAPVPVEAAIAARVPVEAAIVERPSTPPADIAPAAAPEPPEVSTPAEVLVELAKISAEPTKATPEPVSEVPAKPVGESKGESDGVDATAGDADAIDVTDDDLGTPPPPSLRSGLPPQASRLPQLPPSVRPSLEPTPYDPFALGASTEPVAPLLRTTSELATLTAGAPRPRGGLFLAVGVALLVGVGVGGWCIGRFSGRKAEGGGVRDVHVLKSSVEAHVESVTPVTSVAEPAASIAPTATPSPSAGPSATAMNSAPSATAMNSAPSATTPPSVPTRAAPAGVTSTAAPRRLSPPRDPANAGYRPGGI